MQQNCRMLSRDCKPLDQRFEVTRSPLNMLVLISRLHQPRKRPINHHQVHCHHRHQRQPQNLNQQFLIHPDLNCVLDFIHCIFIMLNSQGQFSLSSNPSNQIRNQVGSEEESQREPKPRDPAEVARFFRFLEIKENHLPISQDQVNADHQEAQSEEELLQGLILQEWYQGDLQGSSADQVKSAITKELRQIGPQGHDAYDTLSSLTETRALEERRSVIESRWVIGPRPGSELKGGFCAKGFRQAISRDDKHASTPQSTTLKLILLLSRTHQWQFPQRPLRFCCVGLLDYATLIVSSFVPSCSRWQECGQKSEMEFVARWEHSMQSVAESSACVSLRAFSPGFLSVRDLPK